MLLLFALSAFSGDLSEIAQGPTASASVVLTATILDEDDDTTIQSSITAPEPPPEPPRRPRAPVRPPATYVVEGRDLDNCSAVKDAGLCWSQTRQRS